MAKKRPQKKKRFCAFPDCGTEVRQGPNGGRIPKWCPEHQRSDHRRESLKQHGIETDEPNALTPSDEFRFKRYREEDRVRKEEAAIRRAQIPRYMALSLREHDDPRVAADLMGLHYLSDEEAAEAAKLARERYPEVIEGSPAANQALAQTISAVCLMKMMEKSPSMTGAQAGHALKAVAAIMDNSTPTWAKVDATLVLPDFSGAPENPGSK